MNKFNLDYIDSMRGIAILMVLAVHFTTFFSLFSIETLPFGFENILFSGKYGVALFFIVSAYTLFRSLEIRQETGLINYYIRRFFRIAPMYYIVLIFLFIVTDGQKYYMEESESGISFLNLITHFLFINGYFTNYFNSIIGVEWTIFVEVFFYLTLPFLFYMRRFLFIILIFSVYVSHHNDSFVGILTNGGSLASVQLYLSPITWYFTFIFGGIIYVYGDRNKVYIHITKYYVQLILIILCLYTYAVYYEIKKPYTEHLIISILLSLFFLINKHKRIILFNNIILNKIGKVSFSIYLIHMPIIIYAKNFIYQGGEMIVINSPILSYIAFCTVIFLFILILSFLTYRYIEQPFMLLGKNVIKILKEKN